MYSRVRTCALKQRNSPNGVYHCTNKKLVYGSEFAVLITLLREFEFKIYFSNSSGNRSGFLGYRGNRESRAPSGKKCYSGTKTYISLMPIYTYQFGSMHEDPATRWLREHWISLPRLTIYFYQQFLFCFI